MFWLVAFCFSLGALRSNAAEIAKNTGRLIVKVQAPLAKSMELALPLQTMEIVAGETGNVHIDQFLSRFSVRKTHPLYPSIVRLKKQQGLTDLQIATAIRQRFGHRALRLRGAFQPPEVSRTYVFELEPALAQNADGILHALQADPNVEFVEEDRVVTTNFIPNDPYFSSYGSWGQAYLDLWGINLIGSAAAWDTSTGAGVIVGVVDTGIDFTHPDIVANIWTNTAEIPNNGIDDDHNGYIDDVHGWDFIGSTYTNPVQSNNPVDHFGHGTHVSGTIAAAGNNGIGVIGVAWNAQIMPVKGLDDNGYGLDSTLGPALLYAANNGADVISNSWTGQGSSQTIADAVSYAYNLGVVIVAAAGNNSDDARNYYPANLPQVITVAATDHNDNIAYFSNWGSKIDVAAPGVDILSLRAAGTSMGTPVNSLYTRADGTSMATPHVSGLAALILAQHPNYVSEDVRQVLRVTGTDLGQTGFDTTYGYGRINAAAALALPDVLQSKIQSPADSTHIKTPTTISGLAQGSAFAQYVLDYGAGSSPSTWTIIQTGTTSVSGGTLGVFDPSALSEGAYTIRLTAYDQSGRAFVDRIMLVVDYVSITSPAPPAVPTTSAEFKPGTLISVQGTATGASFQDFRVQWAEGINPTSGWSSSGISLVGGGLSPINNALIATWDTTSITSADWYTIELLVDNTGFTSQATTIVYLEPSLLTTNWPLWLDQAPQTFNSGLVPQVDPLGNVRFTAINPAYSTSTIPSQFWSIPADGSTPNVQNLNYGAYFQPAAGDLDGLVGDEVVAPEAFSLRVFRSDYSSYSFTTGAVLPTYYNFQYAQTVLEDLNLDSQLETIAFGNYWAANTGYVFAWQRNGQQLNSNFPIAIADQNVALRSAFGPRLLVGDVDGDGSREIVVEEGTTSSTSTLRLFASEGTPKPWSAPVFTGHPTEMILADLDHNGKLETIVAVDTGSQKLVHVLQPDGTERPGWPVILAWDSFCSMAVGDLNRDGNEEIVVTDYNYLYVLTTSGLPLSSSWPRVDNIYASFGSVVLADIDGDGRPEIITTRGQLLTATNPLTSKASSSASASSTQQGPQISFQKTSSADGNLTVQATVVNQASSNTNTNYYLAPQIVALHPDNTIVRSWNLMGANGNQPDSFNVLTVGDFNHDGIADIAAVYWTVLGGTPNGALQEGVATVLSTGAPFNAAANDWPMIYQNPRNTAVLIRDHTPPKVSIASPSSGASVSGQVTVTANAWDNVMVTGVQFQLDGSNLGSVATTAPFSVAWDTTQASQGTHTLTAIATDSAGNSATSAPVTVVVAQVATLTVSPSSLAFSVQLLNTTSAPQTVTLTNTGTASVTISGVSTSGDFAQTNNCGATLAPGTGCTVSVTYTPTVHGPETGSLTIGGNFSGAPSVVALSGTGQAFGISISPLSLSFGNQLVNTTSAPQSVTITNSGDISFYINGYSYGSPFSVTNNCPFTINPGATCTFNVTFAPASYGNYQGTFSFSGSFPGSPASIAVSGTGQDTAAILAPASLSFGNQLVNTTSSQAISLVNTANTPVTISSMQTTGDFSQTNNCGTSVVVGSYCTIYVTFQPSATGARSGSLTVSSNARIAIPPATLSGTGTAPAASFNVSLLTFPAQRVNTASTVQTANLTNSGTAALTISSFSISGDFTQINNCGTSLSVGSTCSVNITFKPTATGSRTGTLTLNSNNPGAAPAVALAGTGVASMAALSATSLTFANQIVNTTSTTQVITVTNSGTAPLNVSSISISGDFSQTNNCGVVAAGATCTLNIAFTPTATGTRTGTLTITDDALNGSPQTASLTGTGVAALAALFPSSLTFANQNVNTTSTTQPVTLTNSGTSTLNISSISTSGDFSQTNNCGTSLAAGASCTLNVAFTPTATGTRTGTLTIADNASNGSPQTASLSGTGVSAIAALSPTSLTFANQNVNTTSTTQAVKLTNSGTGTLSISSISISGDFSQTNNCGTSLAAGASCTLNIAFTPTAAGTRTGTLTMADNALNGSPQTASLTGTGVDFSLAASPSSVTVTAGGSASYMGTVTALGGNLGATVSLTCSSGLPAASSCSFSPASVSPGSGSATAGLKISTTARQGKNGTPAGTYTITLQGVSGSRTHTTTVTLKVN